MAIHILHIICYAYNILELFINQLRLAFIELTLLFSLTGEIKINEKNLLLDDHGSSCRR